MQAEFFDDKPLQNISWTEKIKYTLNHLFMHPGDRTGNFSE